MKTYWKQLVIELERETAYGGTASAKILRLF